MMILAGSMPDTHFIVCVFLRNRVNKQAILTVGYTDQSVLERKEKPQKLFIDL